jgi:hypothetical protein
MVGFYFRVEVGVQGQQPPQLGSDFVRGVHGVERTARDAVDPQHVPVALPVVDPEGRVLEIGQQSDPGDFDRVSQNRLRQRLW